MNVKIVQNDRRGLATSPLRNDLGLGDHTGRSRGAHCCFGGGRTSRDRPYSPKTRSGPKSGGGRPSGRLGGRRWAAGSGSTTCGARELTRARQTTGASLPTLGSARSGPPKTSTKMRSPWRRPWWSRSRRRRGKANVMMWGWGVTREKWKYRFCFILKKVSPAS